MKKLRMVLLLSLIGLLTFATPVMTANAAWKTTAEGKMYTTSASPGYLTGLKKIGKHLYYFNEKGIMQKGFHTINGKTYYFLKKNGKAKKNSWLTAGAKKYRYYFNKNSVMVTGHQKIKDKYYFFNEKGIMQKGWIRTDAGSYYADEKTGVLAVSTWINDYYFGKDGKMAVNTWIEGKWVGADGKYTGVKNNVGWVKDGGKTYYYDTRSNLVKGWLNLKGNTYYMHPVTGELMKGWFKLSGNTYYAEPTNGVIQKKKWVNGKYLKKTGIMATGFVKIGKKKYYFNENGVKQTGWQVINQKTYYFNAKGVMQKKVWVDNCYLTSNGSRASGFFTLDKKTYYFSPSTGKKTTGWMLLNGDKYYFKPDGSLRKSGWILSKKYYAGNTGAILKGLNTINKKLYYFDPTTGLKLTRSMKTIGNDTYYFNNKGRAVKSKWVQINSKYYYFQADGKLAKNTWVGLYYVGADGARTGEQKTVGWNTVNGVKYYYDENGNMATGFTTIGNNTYYFDSTGAMQKGLQTIGTKKYYFYSDGTMAVSLSIIIGTKQYTINAKGVVTAETSIKIEENSTGAKIVNFALQYVGNPYVYGGTSLTNGADCSGFVQTVFAKFGYKLVRVADDQMKGPSSYYANQGYLKPVVVDMSSIMPGDLIFYGSGNYATHVAIYMGNGQIVHASNSQPYPKGGIKVSNYDYQTPLKAVRYWS